jgi:exopolysaccharide biosynthesis protein
MKKKVLSVLKMVNLALCAALLTVTLTTISSGSAQAASPIKKQVGLLDAKSNQTFIPVATLNQFPDVTVQWIAEQKKIIITQNDKTLTFTVGSKSAQNNEEVITLKEAPFVENGVTYIPVAPLGQAFGYSVVWSNTSTSISIGLGDASVILPVAKKGQFTASSKPITNERKTFKVKSKSFSVQMVTVSLLHPKIQLDVALAGNEIGKVEDLSSIAKRNKAIVAINGTFFDAYTKESFKTPYGYIVKNGERKHYGDNRSIFTFDYNSFANVIHEAEYKEKMEVEQIDGAIQAGPRLIVNGKIALDVKNEGFKDPKILTGGGARSALGITKDHKLILITTGGATIPQLAEIMKQAGAYQAMNLDGGASSGLYYNGKYLTSPGRKISNAIIVKYQ